MATFSTNLALTLLNTGEGAGTWGNTTNTNLGTLLEQAISGYVTQAVATGTDTTLTIPNGTTGVARNMYIELTGTGGASTNLIVPVNKKLYFIYNNSTGAVTVKVSGQTGVSVAAAEKKILVSNGTDIVEATTYIISGGSGNLTTLTATSANITTLTGTTFGTTATTQLRGASAQITTLTGTSANITTFTSTSANITTLTGTSMNVTTATHASANITQLQSTSATITTLTGTSANITTLTGTSMNVTTATHASANITQLQSTSATITTLTGTSANITTLTGTSMNVTTATHASANITTLTGTSATITTLTGTSANIGDIAFSSATVTTTGTNQNLVLNPNGNGAVLVNSTTDSGFSANGVAFEAIASATGLIHPFLSKASDAIRAANICWNAATSGDNVFVAFGTEATYTARGSITYNRGAGQVAYNTTSDRRAKTISGPVTNSGQVIDQLKVYNGKMNWGTIEFPMMIADEAQQTTPYCVTGKPNAVDAQGNPIYQQMDYSALVPLLIAEIQSLRARVAALEVTP